MFRSLVMAVGVVCGAADVGMAQLPARQIEFTRRPASRGDVAAQAVRLKMLMDVSIVQGRTVLQQEQSAVQRRQDRVIRLTRVEQGAPLAAEVTYQQATEAAARQGMQTEPQSLPVEGKTYRVERRGESLWITDKEGNIPPQRNSRLWRKTWRRLARRIPWRNSLPARQSLSARR